MLVIFSCFLIRWRNINFYLFFYKGLCYNRKMTVSMGFYTHMIKINQIKKICALKGDT